MSNIFDWQKPQERAFLIAVNSKKADTHWSVEDSLAELASLAKTAGAEVVGTAVQQLEKPDPRTYFGKGRAEELVGLCSAVDASLIIADDELTPNQQLHLEEILKMDVIDRTALILDIFALHARSREGQMQVELAQYEYQLPRLLGLRNHLSRQAGGAIGGAIGTRGPGETRLEVNRRRVRDRIAELKQEINLISRHRDLQHKQRKFEMVPVVALVGYTNAGKSTLFNTLTSADTLAENILFATLDPTTRQLTLPGHQEALLSDTVGFIQKLPTSLVTAFRATLEEAREADLLLEVVDISHENAIEQNLTVFDVLKSLKLADKPRITALNKIDAVTDRAAIDTTLYQNPTLISAHSGEGKQQLLEAISAQLTANMQPFRAFLPFQRGDLVEIIHRRGLVSKEIYAADGIHIEGRIPAHLEKSLQQYAMED